MSMADLLFTSGGAHPGAAPVEHQLPSVPGENPVAGCALRSLGLRLRRWLVLAREVGEDLRSDLVDGASHLL